MCCWLVVSGRSPCPPPPIGRCPRPAPPARLGAPVHGAWWSCRPCRRCCWPCWGKLLPGDGNFDTDIFVRDRETAATVRASVRTDGTETGFELGSLNAALSADGQVVAFESEGALVPEDSGFPVDVFVHDEQP